MKRLSIFLILLCHAGIILSSPDREIIEKDPYFNSPVVYSDSNYNPRLRDLTKEAKNNCGSYCKWFGGGLAGAGWLGYALALRCEPYSLPLSLTEKIGYSLAGLTTVAFLTRWGAGIFQWKNKLNYLEKSELVNMATHIQGNYTKMIENQDISHESKQKFKEAENYYESTISTLNQEMEEHAKKAVCSAKVLKCATKASNVLLIGTVATPIVAPLARVGVTRLQNLDLFKNGSPAIEQLD